MSITSLVTISTGEKVANPTHLKCHHKRLRMAQKSLSRKVKGSRNRDKARCKVVRIHQQITDSRKDHLHKLTIRLIRENQTITVESLSVVNMVKNHQLARAISDSDAEWGELVQ